jgi:hypothetical protein
MKCQLEEQCQKIMTTLPDDALQALFLDIEEETTPDDNSAHQNRFYHWLADRFNHRLGNIGNYLKDAHTHIKERVSTVAEFNLETYAKIKEINNTMDAVQKDIQSHVNRLDTHKNETIIHIHDTCQYYESKIKLYCENKGADLKETITEIITTITQSAVDEHITPFFNKQIQQIKETAQTTILEISDVKRNANKPLPKTPWSQNKQSGQYPTAPWNQTPQIHVNTPNVYHDCWGTTYTQNQQDPN